MSAQLLGIASAVDTIHNPPYDPDGSCFFGRHGDIKPENILWFRSNKNPHGLFVLSDFGGSSVNRRSSRSNVANTDLTTVELQRQFLALRRAGALPLQARLERRSLSSGALLTHRELSFVFSLGASLPPFLPNQVTLQLHFRFSHELRTLSETFHNYL